MIGDGDKIVKVDESDFKKMKYQRGHRIDRVGVLDDVERVKDEKIMIQKCDRIIKVKFERFLKKFAERDSIIYTNYCRGYSTLENYINNHKIVSHSREFVDNST